MPELKTLSEINEDLTDAIASLNYHISFNSTNELRQMLGQLKSAKTQLKKFLEKE